MDESFDSAARGRIGMCWIFFFVGRRVRGVRVSVTYLYSFGHDVYVVDLFGLCEVMSVFDDVGNGRCRRLFKHVVYVVGDSNITLNVELVKLVKEREN